MKGFRLYRRLVTNSGVTLYAGSSFAVLSDDGRDVELMVGGEVYTVSKKALLDATY